MVASHVDLFKPSSATVPRTLEIIGKEIVEFLDKHTHWTYLLLRALHNPLMDPALEQKEAETLAIFDGWAKDMAEVGFPQTRLIDDIRYAYTDMIAKAKEVYAMYRSSTADHQTRAHAEIELFGNPVYSPNDKGLCGSLAWQLGTFIDKVRLIENKHDPVTGLPRRELLYSITNELQDNGKSDRLQHYAVLMIDADKFKSVNDTYGHHVGDVVLKLIGFGIARAMRQENLTPSGKEGRVSTDIAKNPKGLFRWGGEEFVGLIYAESSEELAIVAERIRSSVEHLFKEGMPLILREAFHGDTSALQEAVRSGFGDKPPKPGENPAYDAIMGGDTPAIAKLKFPMTVSVGGVLVKDCNDIHHSLKVADKRAYDVKNGPNNGRNGTCVADGVVNIHPRDIMETQNRYDITR